MVLNGKEYKVNLAPAIGRIQEYESGFSRSNSFTVFFPTKNLNRLKTSGFELTFNPQIVTPNEIITSKANANDTNYENPPSITYIPIFGHKFSEEQMLVYSSRSGNGSIKVRFDVLEPEIGGKVKGVILEAVLYGFYDSNRVPIPQEPNKPNKPQKLEIYNFTFDTTFEDRMF